MSVYLADLPLNSKNYNYVTFWKIQLSWKRNTKMTDFKYTIYDIYWKICTEEIQEFPYDC
jgi:hypothetical protein